MVYDKAELKVGERVVGLESLWGCQMVARLADGSVEC